MFLLLLGLMMDVSGESRAKAILALAAAAAQAKPVSMQLFFECLSVMPNEAGARPPKPDLTRLTLEEGAALAAKARLPLVVWVGRYDNSELRSRLPKCVQVQVPTWKGSADKGIVCCPLHGGGPLGLFNPPWPVARKILLAAEVDTGKVLKELSGDWLQQQPPAVIPKRRIFKASY